MKDAVTIEKEFICEALPCKLIGMNSKLMSKYKNLIKTISILLNLFNKLKHKMFKVGLIIFEPLLFYFKLI